MTNTEFIMREKMAGQSRMERVEIRFRPVDGALILAFLAGFVGLVLLLSK